jgi:selenocysteine lyase/cysteine desulfurase
MNTALVHTGVLIACDERARVNESRIEVPVKCVQGRLYVRVSVHLYNQLSDYERLADAIQDIALHTSAQTS